MYQFSNECSEEELDVIDKAVMVMVAGGHDIGSILKSGESEEKVRQILAKWFVDSKR